MAITGGFRFRSRLRLSFLAFLISSSLSIVSGHDFSIVATHPTTIQLSSGHPVENSPGSKPGELMFCERVHIRGLSRLKDLKKYAHSLKVKANISSQTSSRDLHNVEVCFHRNTSIGIGMCPPSQWERLVKGSWVRSMSPYDDRILDIRMPSPSLNFVVVSIEEEFLLYRLTFLVVGIAMMTLAPALSKSIVFYYSSAMTVGIILVMLMVLYQGMKLLPTGRKSSLAIFMYSSIVGVGTFLLRYLSGLLRSILVQIGISEDMYNPVAMFVLVFLVLTGAWLGFWGVRKLVLDEGGSIDTRTAHFVAWSIWLVSAVMILQSSMDTQLAAAALLFGIVISSITRRIGNSKFLRHLYKHPFRTAKSIVRRCQIQYSLSEDSPTEYLREVRKKKSGILRAQTKPVELDSYASPTPIRGNLAGLTKTPPRRSSDVDTHYSTFHKTPERKKFSKEEWESFTRDNTRKAMEDLVSSPDFSQWVVANSERITVTTSTAIRRQPRSWFRWS